MPNINHLPATFDRQYMYVFVTYTTLATMSVVYL
jgi:hypothetical protein